ncbi:MAG: hypothetical protein ACT4OE_11315 [Sphingosinicella sp.]
MRYLLAALLLIAGSPALATGGISCRTTDGSGIVLNGAVGHTITLPLVGARLTVNGGAIATEVGRSWIDAREIRVDLVDPGAMRFEAQLRARMLPRNRAAGTLRRGGRVHPVRCEVE